MIYLKKDNDGKNVHGDLEREQSNSKYDRSTYINRDLIFSDRYIAAIKLLNEDRYVTKSIYESARKMLNHHHGNKYEDLYFIDSSTNTVKARTDYKDNVQEVFPTEAMKAFALQNPNIISIHNHPTSTIPSYKDIMTCHEKKYKYGLVVCHNGRIYQYYTTPDAILDDYEFNFTIYIKKENDAKDRFMRNEIDLTTFNLLHYKYFTNFASKVANHGIFIKEVLYNDGV